MKRCLILIYMLGNILFAAADNTATKEALSVALKSISSPEEKLETLTNLMDISRQEEQVDYAKQLYKEALANDNDYYKEAALTEILRFYVNNDIKDSTNVYMEEAKRELKGKARDFLVTYMQTIIDVRVVFYTEGEDRKKLIEQYRLKLETDKNLSVLEKYRSIMCSEWLTATGSNRVTKRNGTSVYAHVLKRSSTCRKISRYNILTYSA